MTTKLYDVNPYLSEFTSVVLAVTEKGIELEQTAFFPEEGGQSCDEGEINGVKILYVYEENQTVYHKTENDSTFFEGMEVHGVIDFKKRFSNMQNHSGEHIVSGLVHSVFGYDNVGFHLNEQEIALDFNGILNDTDLEKIERLANNAVWKNIDIKTFFPSGEEIKTLMYRSKKEVEGKLRLVLIEGIDLCACCAPHVHKTGEIGLIKIIGRQKHRSGTRVYILCGERAVEDYGKKQEQNYSTSVLLKVPEYETFSAVEKLLKKKCDLDFTINSMKSEMAREKAKGYREKDSILAFEEFTGHPLTNFANELHNKTRSITAVFSKAGEKEYQYMILSHAENLSAFVKEMNTALSGRGGGKPCCVQGNVAADEQMIKEFFRLKNII